MTYFIILIVCGFVLWYMVKNNSAPSVPQPAAPSGIPDHIKQAIEQLTRATTACQADHPESFPALVWMASSDGTVSRQEMRIIIGFCERQGTALDAAWKQALEHLNSGMNLSITGGETGALDHVQALQARPLKYRAAFLGAAEALAAANKTVNSSKNRLLEAARKIIEE